VYIDKWKIAGGYIGRYYLTAYKMENKTPITAVITFSQSKKYLTDWKVRTEYKNGYKTVLVNDEISKNTKFSENPDVIAMRAYASSQAQAVADSFNLDLTIIWSQSSVTTTI